MTAGPCFAKSSCRARMNFSLSLLRLPMGRPFGLPDWPGCHCGADGFGRAMAVYPELSGVPIYGTSFNVSERSVNVNVAAGSVNGRQPRSLTVKLLLLRGIALAWSNQH